MTTITKGIYSVAAMACILFLNSISVAELTPHQILLQADKARGNLEGVQWTVDIISKEKDKRSGRKLVVKSKEYDFLATFVAPPRAKRQKLLMVKHNMWFAKPGLKKPVPISPRQRLLGAASYGDIAATNYSGDYGPKRLPDEKVNNELCYVFDLKASKKHVTYDRIKYWISKKRLVGVKAQYYTVSGKMFKSATFDYANPNRKNKDAQALITKMTIKDALVKDSITTLAYSQYKQKKIPASIFSTNFLMTR